MKLISVVIPAFNAAESIARSLDSVFNQTFRACEIIVVDDGSTDDTAGIVAAYAGRGVQLIRQENQGSAAARQAATDRATSEYIAYLDADDVWPASHLAECFTVASLRRVDFMFGDLRRQEGAHELPRNSTFFPKSAAYIERVGLRVAGARSARSLTQKQATTLLLQGFPAFPSTYFVRRSAIAAVGGWDAQFKRAQDFDIALRLARRFGLHYRDDVCAVLGIHGGNGDERAYVIKQTRGDIQVLSHHVANTATLAERADLASALGRKYLLLAYTAKRSGLFSIARQAYADSLRFGGGFHALVRLAAVCLRRDAPSAEVTHGH